MPSSPPRRARRFPAGSPPCMTRWRSSSKPWPRRPRRLQRESSLSAMLAAHLTPCRARSPRLHARCPISTGILKEPNVARERDGPTCRRVSSSRSKEANTRAAAAARKAQGERRACFLERTNCRPVDKQRKACSEWRSWSTCCWPGKLRMCCWGFRPNGPRISSSIPPFASLGRASTKTCHR